MGYEIEKFYKGVGCRKCRNTGYSGRLGVHELLVINDELRDAIVAGASDRRAARASPRSDGMITLRHDGFRKVREGITTLEEVIHACGQDPEFSELKETARE